MRTILATLTFFDGCRLGMRLACKSRGNLRSFPSLTGKNQSRLSLAPNFSHTAGGTAHDVDNDDDI